MNTGSRIYNIDSFTTEIAAYVFYNHKTLAFLEINEGLTTINNYTFANIQKLRTIMLPKTLTKIKSYAFDSVTIKSIFYLETIQMTCEDKILEKQQQKQRK